MKKLNLTAIPCALLTLAIVASTASHAETQSSQAAKSNYGDNPNIFKVLAKKTQNSVQNTAERIGSATERGIAKIKPGVDNSWKNTKEYTTEQATIARDNTRKGIDNTVKKVQETKQTIFGSDQPNGVKIERAGLSQNSSASNSTISNISNNTAQLTASTPLSTEDEYAEIQRQSLPVQNLNVTDTTNLANTPSTLTSPAATAQSTVPSSTDAAVNSSDDASLPR